MIEKYKLTVICPGIRTANWQKLYESIEKSFSEDFEIIFVGPYDIPEIWKNKLLAEGKTNFKYIKDMGSPIRSQQIGLTFAQGQYIVWAADDGEFLPGALDIGMAKIRDFNFSSEGESQNVPMYKVVVMGKYYEGSEAKNSSPYSMDKNFYYVLYNHDATRCRFLPRHYLMLNVGLVSRQLLFEVGGWDCCFEVCPMSYNDLAIRLQNFGCKFLIQDEIMFTCSHLPGHAGDHGPIHDGQILHDQPLFRAMYREPTCNERVKIDLDNWKNAPARWIRRFGPEEAKQVRMMGGNGEDGCT